MHLVFYTLNVMPTVLTMIAVLVLIALIAIKVSISVALTLVIITILMVMKISKIAEQKYGYNHDESLGICAASAVILNGAAYYIMATLLC